MRWNVISLISWTMYRSRSIILQCEPFLIRMDSPTKYYQLDQVNSVLRVVGWHFLKKKKILILIEHSVASSGDPDKAPHSVASDLGLNCAPTTPQKRMLGLYGLK